MTPLTREFVPGPADVICARGKEARDHPGNIRFRRMIAMELERYSIATSKLEKSEIVLSIVEQIRKDSPDGGFVRQEGDKWFEVGDHLAREKVGQSFRDLLHSKYQSSSKAKRRRRIETNCKVEVEDESIPIKCTEIIDKVREESLKRQSEGEIQSLFNQANSEILEVLKASSQAASKKRRVLTTAKESAASTFETIPLKKTKGGEAEAVILEASSAINRQVSEDNRVTFVEMASASDFEPAPYKQTQRRKN